ncbi:hypothetical protein C8F01DRAFT_41108 [Mycena amicta]|nr:hypothetical protein C8F01DRAFT_41108 [Mycena amicta]
MRCRRPSISVHFAPSHSLSCCRSIGQRSLTHSLWSISTGGSSKLGRADARYVELQGDLKAYVFWILLFSGGRAVMNRGRDQKARTGTRKRGSVAIFKVTRREQGKGDVVALRSRRCVSFFIQVQRSVKCFIRLRTGARATLTVGHRYPPRLSSNEITIHRPGPHLSEKILVLRSSHPHRKKKGTHPETSAWSSIRVYGPAAS